MCSITTISFYHKIKGFREMETVPEHPVLDRRRRTPGRELRLNVLRELAGFVSHFYYFCAELARRRRVGGSRVIRFAVCDRPAEWAALVSGLHLLSGVRRPRNLAPLRRDAPCWSLDLMATTVCAREKGNSDPGRDK